MVNVNLMLSGRMFRFAVAGFASAGLEMGLLVLMVEQFGLPLLHANGISFLIVNVVNYVLSRYWVFNNKTQRKRVQFPMFMFFVTCGLILNQAVLWFLAEQLLWDYRFSKVIAIGVVVIWNFFTRNNMIFKEAPKA